MKRFISIFVLLLLALSVLLVSCGDASTVKSGESKNDGKVILVGENGEEVSVEINEDKDLESYTIIRDDNAPDKVVDLVVRLRADIKNKANADLGIGVTVGGSNAKQIIVKIDESLGEIEYSINAKNNRVFVSGGSLESLTKAVDMFVRNFIRGAESSLLIPADGGYSYDVSYYFDKLTVEGVDISEFTFYEDESDESVINYNKKIDVIAEKLNALFAEKLIGKSLDISEVLSKEGKQIIVSSASLNVKDYSVKIENGNIYLTGSFASVEAAADYLVSEIFGYSEDSAEQGKTLEVGAQSYEGTMELEVPYTVDQLKELFAEAYERDDMVITGTHTYGDQRNGSGIQKTVDSCIKATGESVAIMEIDVGQFGPYNNSHLGEDTLYQYDISQLVSEGMIHVSNGGIIAIVAHFGNPLNNADDGSYYRGYLGGDNVVEEMLTEGTELNTAFRATLDGTVRVIEAFAANGIPIMFRPFHENNADWFWWCANQGSGRTLSPEAMANMWKYLYNIVTVEKGAKDVMWIFSTSFNGSGKQNVLYAYPGDEYVDMVGIDWYTGGKQEYNAENSYSDLMSTGKPAALTEIGPGDSLAKKRVDGSTYYTYTAEDMLNDIKQMLSEGLKVSYFATWVSRTVYNLEKGEVLMSDPIMISREDLAQRWAND